MKVLAASTDFQVIHQESGDRHLLQFFFKNPSRVSEDSATVSVSQWAMGKVGALADELKVERARVVFQYVLDHAEDVQFHCAAGVPVQLFLEEREVEGLKSGMRREVLLSGGE
jgi:hypothetical protein